MTRSNWLVFVSGVHMPKNAGYWQAIDNLAFYIRELSIESQQPVLEAHPWLLDEEHEVQMEFCAQFYTPEQQEKWDRLDEAFNVIMETYGTTYTETFEEVYARIWLFDLQSGELL